jgi:hypothetical protein
LALAPPPARHAAVYRVQLCAQGLRAQAELARACGDTAALRGHLGRARQLLTGARRAAAEAAPVTPNARGWRALAEAEYERAHGPARPDAWSEAATTWEQLERPAAAAYCRWREAEALADTGADSTAPLRHAHAVAVRLGARPLLRELESLAERAQIELGRR